MPCWIPPVRVLCSMLVCAAFVVRTRFLLPQPPFPSLQFSSPQIFVVDHRIQDPGRFGERKQVWFLRRCREFFAFLSFSGVEDLGLGPTQRQDKFSGKTTLPNFVGLGIELPMSEGGLPPKSMTLARPWQSCFQSRRVVPNSKV